MLGTEVEGRKAADDDPERVSDASLKQPQRCVRIRARHDGQCRPRSLGPALLRRERHDEQAGLRHNKVFASAPAISAPAIAKKIVGRGPILLFKQPRTSFQ